MKAQDAFFRGQRRISSRWPEGFTLVELLVVIAIIGVLAAVLLPALSKAKSRALAAQCLGNTKQLQIAWQLYAHDNHDHMVPASGPNDLVYWVDLDYGFADRVNGCTNPLTVTRGHGAHGN